MSGDTVTSRNALQFTNDNKVAYAYSGVIGVDTANTIMLEFNTNSEYLNASIQIYNTSGSGDDIRYTIEFDNVVVMSQYINNANDLPRNNPYIMAIPPFTNVKIRADNLSSATARDHTTHVYAKVGMPQRVGNLDE